MEEPLSSYEDEQDEEPRDVRGRRATVLAGIGLVWAAFMAAFGLVLVSLIVLIAAAVGAAWIYGLRIPRYDLRPAARRTGRSLGQARGVAARLASSGGRRTVSASRTLGASTSRQLSTAGRATADRLSGTPALAARVLERSGEAVRASRPKLSRRPDPRVEQALASNSEGIALAKAGKPAEAIDAFDTALALLAETEDRHHEGQVLVNLGVVHQHVGGDEAARFCWTKALERLEPGTRESERTAELLGVR
jgi:tetratricopeptide (TPR) repeat protein